MRYIIDIEIGIEPIFVETKDDLPAALQNILQDGDILLTQGAGDIGGIATRLAACGLCMETLMAEK